MKPKSVDIKEAVKMSFSMAYAIYMRMQSNNSRRVVLYYHSITKDQIKGFRKQMGYLAKAYKVVKTSEIMKAQQDDAKGVIAITIDDAFSNVYENALPVLREFGLSAAVFAPVGNLGCKPHWEIEGSNEDSEMAIMSYQQLIDMDKEGFEIFSHTFSHPKLTEIDQKKLNVEIAGSKRILERLLGHEVTAISYPYGVHDDSVCKAAKKAGYDHGFTIEPIMVDDSTDQFRIGRFAVSAEDSLVKFKLKCNGAFHASMALSAIKAFTLMKALIIRALKI